MNPWVWNCTATHNIFQDIFFWVSDKIALVSIFSPPTHPWVSEKLQKILEHCIWGTVSVFIVDLNADIRGGFTNLTADYKKLRPDIGVAI